MDLENTKKKMELYQKDNKEVIQKNKLKLVSYTSLPFIFYSFVKELKDLWSTFLKQIKAASTMWSSLYLNIEADS